MAVVAREVALCAPPDKNVFGSDWQRQRLITRVAAYAPHCAHRLPVAVTGCGYPVHILLVGPGQRLLGAYCAL